MQISNQTVSFTNESSKTVSFSPVFDDIPSVSAIAVSNNVEIFVSNLTIDSCTLNTSAPITGQVVVVAVRG